MAQHEDRLQAPQPGAGGHVQLDEAARPAAEALRQVVIKGLQQVLEKTVDLEHFFPNMFFQTTGQTKQHSAYNSIKSDLSLMFFFTPKLWHFVQNRHRLQHSTKGLRGEAGVLHQLLRQRFQPQAFAAADGPIPQQLIRTAAIAHHPSHLVDLTTWNQLRSQCHIEIG